MNKITCLAFLLLISCVPKKTSEPVAQDFTEQEVLSSILRDTIKTNTLAEKIEIPLETISITDNQWLEALAENPFPKELDVIKAMLDSMGVASSYENGENGTLMFDSAEISFNKSYGESICEADIQSARMPLNKGITIGMPLTDFINLTGMKAFAEDHVRYDYTYAAQEHAYALRFDFINRVLTRFHYKKDPCVIYD